MRRRASRTDRLEAVGSGADGGFSLVELIVAIALVSIVMTALATFFLGTLSAMSQLGSRQVAVRLAADANEKVRALNGAQLVTDRDQASSDAAWTAATGIAGIATLLSGMVEAVDPTAAAGSGAGAALPTSGDTVTLDALAYAENWYVGTCWVRPVTAGAATCQPAPGSGYIEFYRVVSVVTWPDKHCVSTLNTCFYAATTLVDKIPVDPLFKRKAIATAPTVTNPGNQVGEVGVAPTLVQMSAIGGEPSLTWTTPAVGLPTGLTMFSNGQISGTPTTAGTYQVTAVVTDAFGLTGTAKFKWTVNALPVLTPQVTKSSPVGTPLSFTPVLVGGTQPLAWLATPLPAGLAIDPLTGAITGTPTTAGTTHVTVTVTDAYQKSSAVTFDWAVLGITTPAAQNGVHGVAAVPVSVVATGGVAPYGLWRATGLPAGLTIDATTGVISGTPTTAGSYPVVVAVTDAAGATVSTGGFAWTVG